MVKTGKKGGHLSSTPLFRTHAGVKEAGVGTNGILKCKSLLQN
jgi:hypothetical protein